MSRRYVTGWYHEGEWRDERRGGPASVDVFEPEPEPFWTGILDARGHRIMAVNELGPVGFFAKVEE